MVKTLAYNVLACMLWLVVATAQAPGPCAGDDCEALQAQLSSAASGLDRSRNQFVSAVRQLIEAIAGAARGDVPARTVGAEELGRALARWDQALRTYRTILLDSAGSSAHAHLALAAAYLERGRGSEAAAQATMAGRLDPDRSESHVLRG